MIQSYAVLQFNKTSLIIISLRMENPLKLKYDSLWSYQYFSTVGNQLREVFAAFLAFMKHGVYFIPFFSFEKERQPGFKGIIY